jgi:hypothetical protein
MPNGGGQHHGPTPLLPNQGRVIQTGPIRVLCIADVRGMDLAIDTPEATRRRAHGSIGNLKSLNDLAKQARADHVIHTGDFGFYDDTSLERIAEK